MPAFQRAGSVQRVGGDDVAKMIGLHFLQQITNAATLQAEKPLGFAALQQFERGFDRPAGI